MTLETWTLLQVASRDARCRALARLRDLMGEEGATAAEYAVLIALIAAVIIAGATVLGTDVNSRLNDFGADLGAL